MTVRIRCTIGDNALDASVDAALVVVPHPDQVTFQACYEATPMQLSYIVAAVIAACYAEKDGGFIVARGVMLARRMQVEHDRR